MTEQNHKSPDDHRIDSDGNQDDQITTITIIMIYHDYTRVPNRKTYFQQQTQIQAKHRAFENNPLNKNSTNSNNCLPLK